MILTNHFVPTIRCGRGKYKAGTGTAACSDCAAGKYKEDEVASDCDACPAHSAQPAVASENATDCKCKIGYSGVDGGACTACPVGMIKLAAGAGICVG